MHRRRHQQSNKFSRRRSGTDQQSRGASWRRKSPSQPHEIDDYSRGRGYADNQYANHNELVPHGFSPFGALEYEEPLQQYPQARRGGLLSRSRSPSGRQRSKGRGKGRGGGRNSKKNAATQRRGQNQINFEPGDYVRMACNGSVAKVIRYGNKGKSRLIQFKHKVYRRYPYGDYFNVGRFRAWQAQLIDEAQYNVVPSDIAFVSPATSPAPPASHVSPSPSPQPMAKVSRNIRFKEEKSAQGQEDDDAADTISDKKMEIIIDTERAPDVATSPTVHTESFSVEELDEVEVEIDEMEPGQVASPGSRSKCDTAAPDLPAVEPPTPEHETVVAAEDAKERERESKAEMLPIFKRPKDTVGAKFAEKMKKLYRVSDLRERAFLLMCDESKMVDLQSMCDYLAHFGGPDVKVRKKTAKGFFESMKPTARSLVTFSRFVKAVDKDGDVVAAYERFKASGTSRSRKN